MTWPKNIDKDKYKEKDNDKDKDILRTLLRAIPETCDIWDTDYNSDNWESEFMTIFVTWQLIVTLDSIRNSCDVYSNKHILSEKNLLVVLGIFFFHIHLTHIGEQPVAQVWKGGD